jgi:predicted RNA-binding protein associated with RNAse of E/G family
MAFDGGQTIVRRNLYRNGQIGAVETARVVSDDDRGVLTWTAPGSEVMRRCTLDGEPTRRMSLSQRLSVATMLVPDVWRDTGVLILTPPNVGHSVWWFFDTGFLGWYVNLEAPARRWFGGLDTTDFALDIWVAPDRSWTWKDEDEFAERVGHPLYWSADKAAAIRAEGEHVIGLIEAGTHPFDGWLTDFLADPRWEPSRLPPHWDLPDCGSIGA